MEQTASQIQERPPLYWEAVTYCRENDIPAEDAERVRTMLAVREFMRRVEPYKERAAKIMAALPGRWVVSEGYVRADTPREVDAALKLIQDMIDAEAEKLGLSAPAREPQTP